MKEKCPVCSYDFRDYIEKGMETNTCPNCQTDLRMYEVEEWQRKCKTCGADVWKEAYDAKQAGKDTDECPYCFNNLKDKFYDAGKGKCSVCGTDLSDLWVEGTINFTARAMKTQAERYMVSDSRPINLNINIKCKGCGNILNYDTVFNRNYIDLMSRIPGTFRIGDM